MRTLNHFRQKACIALGFFAVFLQVYTATAGNCYIDKLNYADGSCSGKSWSQCTGGPTYSYHSCYGGQDSGYCWCYEGMPQLVGYDFDCDREFTWEPNWLLCLGSLGLTGIKAWQCFVGKNPTACGEGVFALMVAAGSCAGYECAVDPENSTPIYRPILNLIGGTCP